MNENIGKRPLPMPPGQPGAITATSQVLFFANKQVKIVHTRSNLETVGKIINFTDLGIMVLRADGTMKLIWMNTIVSMEETKIDPSMLSS